MAKKKKKSNTPGSQVIDIEEAQEERRKKRQQAAAVKRRQKRKDEKDKQEEIRAVSTPDVRKKKRKKKVTTKRIVLTLVVLGILTFLALTGYQVIKLKMELSDAQKEHDKKLAEKTALEKDLERINDPEYIEEQARERLRMIRQGEILYVFPEEVEDNTE